MADETTYYEVVASPDHCKTWITLASDLTDEESDRVKREYINKHGCTVEVNGVRRRALICVFRQRHDHKELVEDYEEVKK